MAGEIDLYGIFVPSLLIQALLAYLVLYLCEPSLDRLQAKGWIIMPSLFNLLLYIIILGVIFMISLAFLH
jgi:predicted PurR-regulated permease PerM